jgi:hypothetical protein
MMNPRRLIDDAVDDFERNLLSAGRRDAMAPSSRMRILVGLGLGALVPGTAVAATTKGAAQGGLLAMAAASGGVKLAVGGALGAVAIWSAVALVDVGGSSDVERTGVIEVQPVRQERSPKAVVPVEAVEEPVEAVEEPASKLPPKAAPAADDLGKELSSLDEARAALRAGEPDRTLRLLDEHGRKFPRQRLRVEATVLRIEALSSSGRSRAARKAGEDFLAKHPNGPYAQRVRSLITPERAPKEE